MRNMIRNLMLASAVVATAALASTSAMAATLKVPFSFQVGGKQCPAGTYSVQRGINGGAVTLSSMDGSRNFTWILRPGEPAPGEKAITMHFEEQGENHVLQTVRYGSQVTAPLTGKSNHKEYPAISIGAGEGR